MSKYYKQIDILRGIAITLVLLGHSVIVYPVNLNEITWCGFLHSFVSTVHMPLFFLISGFCYSFRNAGDFYKKKVKRILIPYLVFVFANFALGLLLPAFINNGSGFKGLIDDLLKGTSYWFLYTLFIIFLIFPLIEKVIKKRIVRISVLCLMFLLSLFNFWPKYLSLDKLVMYLPFFTLGYCLKVDFGSFKQIYKKLFGNKVVSLVSAAVMLALWVCVCVLIFNTTGEVSYYITALLSIAAAFLGIGTISVLVNLAVNTKLSDVFVELGKYSLQLYLLDGYMLVISRTILVSVLKISNPFIIIFGIFIFCLVPSYLIIRFIISKVKLFRFLTGLTSR